MIKDVYRRGSVRISVVAISFNFQIFFTSNLGCKCYASVKLFSETVDAIAPTAPTLTPPLSIWSVAQLGFSIRRFPILQPYIFLRVPVGSFGYFSKSLGSQEPTSTTPLIIVCLCVLSCPGHIHGPNFKTKGTYGLPMTEGFSLFIRLILKQLSNKSL